jgi:hypothetical protein
MPVHSGWSPLGVHACRVRPPWRGRQGVWACWLWLLEPQHHAAWGGPRAGARRAPAMGNPRCSKIAPTPPPSFRYAKTRRLPPHLTQANTSKSNVFLRSCAQSTRGVLSFCGSFLAAALSATLASSAPAWGSWRGTSPQLGPCCSRRTPARWWTRCSRAARCSQWSAGAPTRRRAPRCCSHRRRCWPRTSRPPGSGLATGALRLCGSAG